MELVPVLLGLVIVMAIVVCSRPKSEEYYERMERADEAYETYCNDKTTDGESA